MRAGRFSRWVPLLVLSVAAVLLGFYCAHHEQVATQSPESAAPPRPSAAAPQAPAPVQPEAAAPPIEEPGRAELEQAAEPQTPDEEDAGSDMNPVAQFMRYSDEHDRDLLASVERETKKAPSPEVMELLAMRRSGAARAELERFIDSELAADVRVRVAARRWLRASMGGEAPPASPQPGQGGGAQRVKGLSPAK